MTHRLMSCLVTPKNASPSADPTDGGREGSRTGVLDLRSLTHTIFLLRRRGSGEHGVRQAHDRYALLCFPDARSLMVNEGAGNC